MSETQPSPSGAVDQRLSLTGLVARDLWWTAASPPLMTGVARLPQLDGASRTALRNAVLPAVQELDPMDTEAAMLTIGARGWRVGYYFEALVARWLQALPDWRFLATNHQVRHEKRTLGAYDFIVRNANGEVEHWEVAVKFYLRRGGPDEWRSWVGPNQRDRLDKKVNRMRDHQLALSRRDVGMAALQELGVDRVDHHRALLKGCFFTEWGQSPSGPVSSTGDAQGRWIAARRVPELARTFTSSRWIRREKPFWLAPLQGLKGQDAVDELPRDVRRPEMWARLEQTSAGTWDEAQRWFVVPDDWRESR